MAQEHDKDMDDNPEVDAVELLEKKFPPYVVNCLKAAGFDSVDTICSMNVSERRENSIYVIENYIEQYYSTHQVFFANPNGCVQPRPFKFPPGHRMQIINFVKELKKTSKAGQKHKVGDPPLFCKVKVKKRCVSSQVAPMKRLLL